ncbi:MAG TPA: hypothetical protein VHB70_19705 [Parafilimonas sp.]|jgi:hypothetical protein|nr:hypothetical protein [Parafilimonas sp.]
MNKELKPEIYKLIDAIEDENILQMVKEDIAWYADKKDILDELNEKQLNELSQAIKEADNNETTTWNAFKTEINEWKKKQ